VIKETSSTSSKAYTLPKQTTHILVPNMAHMLKTKLFFFSIFHVTEYNHAFIEVTLQIFIQKRALKDQNNTQFTLV
jgi:hypothetical protein